MAGVAWPPSMDAVIRIGWIITILAFVVTVLSGISEYRGRWNLVGEVGLIAGSVITVLIGAGTLAASAGRVQVAGVREAVEANGETLSGLGRKADLQLVRLEALDAIDDLDALQLELDKQTGVLGRQVEILEQIRDGETGAT